MKKQKRDRTQRLYTRGYQAGLNGLSRELCPHQQDELRLQWLNGWREGREDRWDGLRGVSVVHKHPAAAQGSY